MMAAFFVSISPCLSVFAAAPVSDAKPNNLDVVPVSKGANYLRPDVRLERLEKVSDSRGKLLLNMQRDFDDIADQVSQLSGKMEEQNYQLEQVLQRQRELYQELERRLAINSSNASSVDANAALMQSTPVTASTDGELGVPVSLEGNNKAATSAYDAAVNLVIKDKKYDKAVPAFRDFIKKYPKSVYLPNAHYWLGQLLFSQGDKPAATVEFETLVTNYLDSPKRADALLKLGIISQDLGDMGKAKLYLNQVVSEYSDTSSAQLAKDILVKIK